MGETELTAILCSLILGGQAESRQDYIIDARPGHIRVDCETETEVIEVGLDGRRSAYDSLHQALFAASLTGKTPVIVIIDTDGIEEPAQFQIETVAGEAGVRYVTYTEDWLIRMQMTWPFRQDRIGVDLTN